MLDPKNMAFNGTTLVDTDLPRIGEQIGVGEDVMHATIDTETNNRWKDSKGRLPMLYEPHVAFRAAASNAVRDKLIKAGLAYPKWGEKPYPADSYPRFQKAYAIDPETACRACSWGAPQILGEEHARSKYPSAVKMVEAFLVSQTNQLQAMVDFIASKKIDVELRKLQAKIDKGQKVTPDDCREAVRLYNGGGYEKNKYHIKFADNLNKWVKIPDTPWTKTAPEKSLPATLYDGKYHVEIESTQKKLDELGYPEVGSWDGKWGSKTQAAVLAFRADNGLPTTPTIDNQLLSSLMTAQPRKIDAERADATLTDLRKDGAEDVKAADATQVAGTVAAAGGVLGAVSPALDLAEGYSDAAKRAIAILHPVQDFFKDNFWLILLGVGGFVIWKTGVLKNIRLVKHQTGQDVSV